MFTFICCLGFSSIGSADNVQQQSYTVGKNIKSGIYNVTLKSGTGELSDHEYDFDVVMSGVDTKTKGYLKSYRLILSKNEKFTVTNCDLDFKKISGSKTTDYLNSCPGMYRVGKDIKPGKYIISSIDGYAGSYNIDDESPVKITGDGDKATSKLTLKKGQILYINIQKFELKKDTSVKSSEK